MGKSPQREERFWGKSEREEGKRLEPHILQPVHRQQVSAHGEVEFIDEGSGFRWWIQQINDGAAQIT